MKSRRTFLAGSGLACAGLPQIPALFAQDAPAKRPIPRDLADFWVNRVGLKLDSSDGPIAPAPATSRVGLRGKPPTDPYGGDEPLFLFADPDENRLIPASELPRSKLLPPGDATVDIRVLRARMNSDDHARLEKYESAAIYLEVQQKALQTELDTLASAMLGAVFPRRPLPAPMASRLAAPRQPGTVQSIGLPDGVGSASFSCFLQNRKRSAFGRFADVLVEMSGAAAMDFFPLLHMPGLMPAALGVIRKLVFQFQHLHEYEWLMRDGGILVACCSGEEAGANNSAVRLRTGNYIVIPRAHSSALKASVNGVKVDGSGFLVPKSAGALDAYDAAPETAKGVSYLSLAVTVKKAKLNRCPAPVF